jgi:hypothetical protein
MGYCKLLGGAVAVNRMDTTMVLKKNISCCILTTGTALPSILAACTPA